MIIYVVTIYNTFANGTRYVEVNRSAFRTLDEARKMIENIDMKQSTYSDLVYEDIREGFNLSTGKFEKMRQALITEVKVVEESVD